MKARHDFKSDEHYEKYLRDYFAGKVLQGKISDGYRIDKVRAKGCYRIADKMIKAR